MHGRTRIRNAVVNCLRANMTNEVPVFLSRRLPLQTTQFPCISVYADSEHTEILNDTPRISKNRLDLVVEVIVSDSENLELTLDEFCLEAEESLAFLDLIELEVVSLALRSTLIDTSVQSDQLVGSAKMIFEIVYLTEHFMNAVDLQQFDTTALAMN